MNNQTIKNLIYKLSLTIAVAVFLFPIWKMTETAMDNGVNLNPLYMVGSAILLSAIIHYVRKK